MAKRRYTSKCSIFLMHLYLADGTHIVHEFKGKNVYTKERYTDVEDPEIQKLLEASSAFGVYFEKSSEFDWMEAEETISNDVEDESVPEDTTPENENETDTEDESDVEDEKQEESKVKVFSTGTDAKYWLNQTMKVPSHKLTNKAKMIEEAALLGYTIEFETK